MKLKVLGIVAIFVVGAALLSACENITPQQAKAIVATYEALPAPAAHRRRRESHDLFEVPVA